MTALRLSCSGESACSSSSSSNSRRRNMPTVSRNATPHFNLGWIEENLSTTSSHHRSTASSSSSSIGNKPKEPQRRPTILVNTVWLPPYEAAVKHSRILNSSSGSSPEQRLDASTTLPTYEEALVLLRQGSTPDGDKERAQSYA